MKSLSVLTFLLTTLVMVKCITASEVVDPAPMFEAKTCGPDTLFVVTKQAGFDISLDDIRKNITLTRSGCTFKDISSCLDQLGINHSSRRISIGQMASWAPPSVLHVNESHFVGYLGPAADGNGIMVFDNRTGVLRLTTTEFQRRYDWDGSAIILGGEPSFAARMLNSGPLSGMAALGLVAAWLYRTDVMSWNRRRGKNVELQSSC